MLEDCGWWDEVEGDVPDAHARTRDGGEFDGAGETLVTLGVVVLEADLQHH
jgi:hypothetical protein